MQSEETIEVAYSALAVESSDCDSRARIVVGGLGVRHHHVESIDRATHKDHDQAGFAVGARARCPPMGLSSTMPAADRIAARCMNLRRETLASEVRAPEPLFERVPRRFSSIGFMQEASCYRIMNSGLPRTSAACSGAGAASIAARVDAEKQPPNPCASMVTSGAAIRLGFPGW